MAVVDLRMRYSVSVSPPWVRRLLPAGAEHVEQSNRSTAAAG
ncbi:hypothetical protein [Nocardia brevicatena]|nr:hypothetical protein [Nocardia brevicatena]